MVIIFVSGGALFASCMSKGIAGGGGGNDLATLGGRVQGTANGSEMSTLNEKICFSASS
jgi:hypothetical protein